jgi:hypothetical protein
MDNPLKKKLQYLLFLVAVAAFVSARSVSATPDDCDEVCGPSADCEEPCLYIPPPPFEGVEITCGEYEGGAPDWCEDGNPCGDGVCDNVDDTEDSGNCPEDCGPVLSPGPTCGLYGCEQGESCWNCASDCGTCPEPPEEDDGECSEGEDHSDADCLYLDESCDDDGDCHLVGEFGYSCVNKRCVARDLPGVTTTCNSDFDCQSGFKCTKSDEYECPGSQPSCKVCVPTWLE